MNKEEWINAAKQKVKAKKGFYAHRNAFSIVALTLFVINYFTLPGTWFFVLPIIGWSVALLGHYLRVFGLPSFRDEDWEEAQLEIEMRKLSHEQHLEDEAYLDLYGEKLKVRRMEEQRSMYDSDDLV